MDVPIAIHVGAEEIDTLPNDQANHELQARSLRNTLSILHRRLKHLKHEKTHTFEDVEHYKNVLEHLESRWRDDEGTFAGSLVHIDAALASTCDKLWNACWKLVKFMEEDALQMPEEVRAVHSRLSDLHRRLNELVTRKAEPSSIEVSELVSELNLIDAERQRHGGLFGGDVEAPAPGQTVCTEILNHCYELSRFAMRRAHDEPAELRIVGDKLRAMRNELRKLKGQKHHTAADIASHRFLLGAIASSEAEYAGEWKGSHQECLLAECIAMVDELEATAEEMPPSVGEVHAKLAALRKELNTAVSSAARPQEEKMQKWWAEVKSIDDARAESDGVFGGKKIEGGGVLAPAGQVACSRLLKQCYDLLSELSERS